MSKTTDTDPTVVLTGPVRLAFPALDEPKPTFPGAEDLKYQATLLLPKTEPLKPYSEAIKAAVMAKWHKMVGLNPAKIGLQSCESKTHLAGYDEGWHFINTRTKYPVPCVDRQKRPMDPGKFYGGCWVRAFLNTYAWEFNGIRGVSFGLQALQFVKDDDAFAGGGADPNEVFEALGEIEPESGDELSGGEYVNDDPLGLGGL
jgi:hypothetical protein